MNAIVAARPILLIAAWSLIAQQEPTIRLDVQQVLVPVVVTDKKGHHVSGLHASDFQILEDGVEQEIASFSRDTAGSVDDIVALSRPTAGGVPAGGAGRTAPHLCNLHRYAPRLIRQCRADAPGPGKPFRKRKTNRRPICSDRHWPSTAGSAGGNHQPARDPGKDSWHGISKRHGRV